MNLSADYLYALLPAVYRERDATLGVDGGPGPLREQIEIVAGQLALVDAEIDNLYDDAFIETCAPWVAPYIGDLVGYTPLNVNANLSLSPRAEVANTIRYRRWKGTVTILEQLASDVTGWPALAVEFFTRLATTQFVNHLRPQSLGAADIRQHAIASTAGGPFDANPHTVEVRRIRSKRGRFNIPNVGVYVWRLAAFANFDNPSNAFRIADGFYTFDPLGADGALVRLPALKKTPFTRTAPADVPAPLGVRAVADAGPPYPFHVHDGAGALIPDAAVCICDLSGWTTPAGAPSLPAAKRVAVDPRLGRIWFRAGDVATAAPVLVNCAYAFSSRYGAGFYPRKASGAASLFVLRDPATRAPDLTMTGAVNTALATTASPIVEYADNVTDVSAATVVPISGGQDIVVRAADGRRPTFLGPVTIEAGVAAGQSATFVLEGFVLGAGVVVSGAGALTLVLRNCTVRPGASGLGVQWTGASGSVSLEHSLCAAISVPALDVDVSLADSIVDAGAGAAIVAGRLNVARSTVFGAVSAREIGLIENAIFTATVASQRRQSGCVRYSFLPLASTTPERYRCQPDGATEAAIAAAAVAHPSLTKAQLQAIGALAAEQVAPQFTAVDFGDPAYAQLSVWTRPEISGGADDGGEMGVFHDLYNAIREADLLYRLEQNLPMSLEAGVLHAS